MQLGTLPDSFGRTLAALRQGRLKQAELAKAVAVDASTISRYETGELSPSLADAQALLKAIGTSEAEDYAQYLGQQWRWLPRPSYEHPDRRSLWESEKTLDRLEGLRRP